MQINCRFCGANGGNIDSLDGIVDHRCDSCTQLHGSYKEMEEQFRQSGDKRKFEDVIKKAGYKKDEFEKLLSK